LVCDEIIVVDSYSTDRTVEIASKLGAKVIMQKYLGDGPQKNVASKFSKNKWLLSIDADETLDSKLVESIQLLDLVNTNYSSFSFNRKNYINNHWIKGCGWYPNKLIRLYNHKKASYEESEVHAKVLSNKNLHINGNIIHRTYDSYSHMFDKINRYSSRSANVEYIRGKEVSFLSPLIHGIWSFIFRYFVKKGFMDGIDGLVISISISLGSFLKYAKILEHKRKRTSKGDLGLWD